MKRNHNDRMNCKIHILIEFTRVQTLMQTAIIHQKKRQLTKNLVQNQTAKKRLKMWIIPNTVSSRGTPKISLSQMTTTRLKWLRQQKRRRTWASLLFHKKRKLMMNLSEIEPPAICRGCGWSRWQLTMCLPPQSQEHRWIGRWSWEWSQGG